MSSELSEGFPNDVSLPSTVLCSCLRSRPDSIRRNRSFCVSFPEDESDLITGYLEPANPWEYADNVNHADLIKNYMASCEKHGTNALPHVVEQLQKVDLEACRSDCLNLQGAPLQAVACESLEEVLKRVQFKNINLEATALDDEGSVALFDMIEYYESATHLNISCNKDIAVRGWQACSRMIKKTRCLEELEARNVTLNEQYMPILSRALKSGTLLQVLKLENCSLSGRPMIILAAALKLNSALKELYLADNALNGSDAVQLGAMLRSNQTLQLLDISNNQIQDAGAGHIVDGMAEQSNECSGGLGILILWNNHLTRNAAKHFARVLARSTSLEILNVGHNVLTNESLHVMKDSLLHNRTLLRLGMQSTHLSCEGAIALAECVADNPVIQRIDLRDNNLQVAGLMALALSVKVNRSVSQLDLDDMPKKMLESSEALKQYRSLLEEIRGYCIRNEEAALSEEEPRISEDKDSVSDNKLRVMSSVASRKISLTCETLMRSVCMQQSESEHPGPQLLEPRRASGGRLRSPAPSPVPSPVSSPIPSPSRNRFHVSKVAESSPSPSPSPTRFFPGSSRFTVTLVEPKEGPSPPARAIVSNPSGNNITVGFTFKLNDQNISPKTFLEDSQKSSSPVREDASILSPQLSRLSESLEETSSISPSQSVTSLEDSADLEVREIMDRHDNQTGCSKLFDITPSDEQKLPSELPKHSTPPVVETTPAETAHVSVKVRPSSSLSEKQVSESPSSILKSCKTVNERLRKISWIAPVEPVSSNEQKAPSGLDKLLGLFHHSTSFFSKAQPQYKATTVIVNQQPIANSNASFLLTAGPLAEAAQHVRLHSVSPNPSGEHPATDVLNNNSGDGRGVTPPLPPSSPSPLSQCTLSEKQRTEDENLNVSERASAAAAAGDKFWCSALSSVCSATVVLPWAESSTSQQEKGASESVVKSPSPANGVKVRCRCAVGGGDVSSEPSRPSELVKVEEADDADPQ